MSPSLSRFGFLQRLSARERRVVAGGIGVAVLALLVAFALVPYTRRWSAHTDAIAASRARYDRLRALIASESAFRRALDVRRTARASWSSRLLSGSTPALAASELQALVRRYAELSDVDIDRVNVVGDATPLDGALTAIPLQLSAQGDIHGLSQFLSLVQNGERLLIVDDLTVSAEAPRSDGVQRLTWSMRLRGPYAPATTQSAPSL